jgi:hypothetical protein
MERNGVENKHQLNFNHLKHLTFKARIKKGMEAAEAGRLKLKVEKGGQKRLKIGGEGRK